MSRFRKFLFSVLLVWLGAVFLMPAPIIPVEGATVQSWNPQSFWYEPWGPSIVHKGIDIFAPKGRPIIAPTAGLILYTGAIDRGGQVALMITPSLRVHYFAHLDRIDASVGHLLWQGDQIGLVGDSGNAKGKPPHLHYTVVTLIPYPWRIDDATMGWKKMFYLDPGAPFQKE